MSNFDLQACLDGAPGAWDAFVEAHARVIHAAVRKTVGGSDSQLIEDLVQDVFVRLIRNDMKVLRSFDQDRGASLTTWLTIIARSTAIDALRKRRIQAGSLDALATEPEPPAEPSLRHDVRIPMEVLTERQRLILSMLFDQQMTVPQAARVLGVDDQTVRSTKHKALSRLRKAVSEAESPPPSHANDAGSSLYENPGMPGSDHP